MKKSSPTNLVDEKISMIVTLTEVDDGSGDCILPIPDKIILALGLKEGDLLDMTKQEDGSIIFKKKT